MLRIQMSYLKIQYNDIRSSALWLSVKMLYVDLHHLHTVLSTQPFSEHKMYVMIQPFHTNVLSCYDKAQSSDVQLPYLYTQWKVTFLRGNEKHQLFTKVYLSYL